MAAISTSNWESHLDDYFNRAKSVVDTGDFTPDPLVNQLENNALDGLDPSAKKELVQASEDEVKNHRESYKKFSDEVEKHKSEKLDVSEWESIINKCRDDAKKRAAEIIDNAAAAAKKIIRRLPERARIPAANLVEKGWEDIKKFIADIWATITNIFNAILDFIKGVYTALVKGWEFIQGQATKAIAFLRGLLSFSLEAGWSESYASVTVINELRLLIDAVHSHGLEVHGLNLEKAGGTWNARVRVNESSRPRLRAEMAWNHAVVSQTAATPVVRY